MPLAASVEVEAVKISNISRAKLEHNALRDTSVDILYLLDILPFVVVIGKQHCFPELIGTFSLHLCSCFPSVWEDRYIAARLTSEM